MSFNERLIEEVRKYECLYDLSLKDYRNVKGKIWEKIGKTLNSSSDSCRRRWKTLRDTHTKIKRANELASSSGAPVPKKTWKFQEELSFLDDCKDSMPAVESFEIEVDVANTFLEDIKGIMPENFTMEEDLDLHSSCSSVRSSRGTTKKRAGAELNDSFAKAMKPCISSVSDLAKVPQRNATFALFEYFAQKIVDADLPQADVNRIEAKMMLVLHEELAKFCK